MARPMMNPVVRFGDVLPILEKADQNGTLRFAALDERQAIHICHRLNKCRAAIRAFDPDSSMRFDRFVIRVSGPEVIIAPRPTYDLSNATKADGSPLDSYEEADLDRLRKQALDDVLSGRWRRSQGFDPSAPLDLDDSDPPKAAE